MSNFTLNNLSLATYDNYIPPGQGFVLQFVVSEEDPEQSLPPPDGAGFVHVLVLDCCPVPHVLEHVECTPHALHIPFTEKYCNGNCLWNHF